MRDFLNASDAKVIERWVSDSAREFNLTRFEPIIGDDNASWDVATTADQATVETITFDIAQPGARVLIDIWCQPKATASAAPAWDVGYDVLVDGEASVQWNIARLGNSTADNVIAPVNFQRVVDMASGRHTVVISARKTNMTSGTMYYRYRIDAFYRLQNSLR